jgi:hypothetical protein
MNHLVDDLYSPIQLIKAYCMKRKGVKITYRNSSLERYLEIQVPRNATLLRQLNCYLFGKIVDERLPSSLDDLLYPRDSMRLKRSSSEMLESNDLRVYYIHQPEEDFIEPNYANQFRIRLYEKLRGYKESVVIIHPACSKRSATVRFWLQTEFKIYIGIEQVNFSSADVLVSSYSTALYRVLHRLPFAKAYIINCPNLGGEITKANQVKISFQLPYVDGLIII